MCPDNANNQGKKSPFTQDIFGFLLNKFSQTAAHQIPFMFPGMGLEDTQETMFDSIIQ